MPDKASQQKPLWRSHEFALAVVPIALLLGLVVVAYFYLDHTAELNVISRLEQSHTRLGQRSIERRIGELSKDVRVIAESQSLDSYVNQPNESHLIRLGLEFRNICKHRAVYDQVRYLNLKGMEILRVNYDNGDCRLVSDAELQNKSERYYFRDTIELGPGELFYSPLDLNIERGVIERPVKPVIRIGMPIFDHSGQRSGVILVNYLASELLQEIARVMASENSVPFLLNREGYWLLADKKSFEWGFMFENGTSFEQYYPQIWQRIKAADSGQAIGDRGVFSWASVYPVEEGSISSSGSQLPYSASKQAIAAHQYVWHVGTHIMPGVIATLSKGRIQKGIILYMALLVIAVVGSLFLAFERRRATQYLEDLKENARRLRAITAELGEGLIVLDQSGCISMMNPQAEKVIGWAEDTVKGKHFDALVHDETDEVKTSASIQQVGLAGKLLHVEEAYFLAKSGQKIPVAYTVSPFILDGKSAGTILAFEDITERKKTQAQLTYLATHDSLTGLYNRGEIERCLKQLFIQMDRYRRPLSICLLDIDKFKSVNDLHGHQTGDQVLISFSQLIQKMTRGSDCCGRYGGEEFLLVLPETDLNGALQFGELLRKRVEETGFQREDDHPLNITVSIGVADLTIHTTTPDQLVSRADSALYEAKHSGRNRVRAYQDQNLPS